MSFENRFDPPGSDEFDPQAWYENKRDEIIKGDGEVLTSIIEDNFDTFGPLIAEMYQAAPGDDEDKAKVELFMAIERIVDDHVDSLEYDDE